MKLFVHCMDLVEAHHRANLLRSGGIRAEVRNTCLSGALGDIPFIEAGPQVWIDDGESAATAHAIIEAATSPPTRPAWCCEACQEPIEGQFVQCWRCGATRPLDPP